jgi:hypothetical protein
VAAPRLSEMCCRLTTDFWEVPLKRAAALEIQRAKSYGAQGDWASVRASLSLFPLSRTTPPSKEIEEPGKRPPSIKLKNPNLPSFGTVPRKMMKRINLKPVGSCTMA